MRLPSGWNLPDDLRLRLSERTGRQRALFEGGQLILVLHKPPKPGQHEREGVIFWRDSEGLWRTSDGGNGVQALKLHVENFEKTVDEWEKAFVRADDAESIFRVLQAVGPLGRAAANMNATLGAAREFLPDALELVALRDIASDVERAGELLYQDAKNALDFSIARQNETQSRLALEAAKSGDRLNLIAAIFLPLSAITSLFAMDIHSGLADTPQNFYIVAGFAVAVGLFLGVVLGRRR